MYGSKNHLSLVPQMFYFLVYENHFHCIIISGIELQ